MILALETSSATASAAVVDAAGRPLGESRPAAGALQARRLLECVHEALTAAGVSLGDIETVVCGLGPGTFTGLRIGVATARALAQADGRVRLAGVPTAAALALALAATAPGAAERVLTPLIDGKRHEVFAAVYAASGGGLSVIEDVAIVPADDLRAWLERLGEVLVGGDGALLYAGLLPASARAAGIVAPTAAMVGRAVAVGVPGVAWGADAVLPLYGRVPDAARWVGKGAR